MYQGVYQNEVPKILYLTPEINTPYVNRYTRYVHAAPISTASFAASVIVSDKPYIVRGPKLTMEFWRCNYRWVSDHTMH